MEVEHEYYDLFFSLCVNAIWDDIYSISKERCNGCEIDHPSQTEHPCLMDSTHIKLITSFELAYMKLNIQDIFHTVFQVPDQTDSMLLLYPHKQWQEILPKILPKIHSIFNTTT